MLCIKQRLVSRVDFSFEETEWCGLLKLKFKYLESTTQFKIRTSSEGLYLCGENDRGVTYIIGSKTVLTNKK